MWIFDFFKDKTEKKPALRGVSIGGSLLSYDLSYEVYFKYYNLNPFIFMCINKRSNAVWATGWELGKEGSRTKKWDDKTLFNKDFSELIKDSTSPTPEEFFKRLVRDYDITGNTYIYIVKDESGKKAIWMQVLDPRYVKPVADKFWTLLWYIQNLDWVKVFLKDEIFHLKNDNDVDNEIVGKSRMTSVFIDVETDQEARESNLAFFKNNQTPSSIIIIDPDFEIEDDDLEATKSKLKEMFEGWKYVWGKNKHRSMMAQGIKSVEKIQDKISDMEFIELRKFTLDVVAWVYEVPKSILWFTENANYSNGLNQYDIYLDTIEALEIKFSRFLTKVLKTFDDQYVFIFLQDNLRKLTLKAELAGSLYKDKEILTLNESRAIIQYDKVDDWDKFYENNSITINADKKDKWDWK